MGLWSPRTCRNEARVLCKYETKQHNTSLKPQWWGQTIPITKPVVKKICAGEGKIRLVTFADRTKCCDFQSPFMLPLSPNEWANPHLQDSPQCLGLCLLCWKIPRSLSDHAGRSLSDHAGRIWALFAIHYKGEKQILSRIRRSIFLIGKTFSVFSHLSQKGVWLLGLPISPQRSDTSQTKLMADRKNWLVSENSFSDEVSE